MTSHMFQAAKSAVSSAMSPHMFSDSDDEVAGYGESMSLKAAVADAAARLRRSPGLADRLEGHKESFPSATQVFLSRAPEQAGRMEARLQQELEESQLATLRWKAHVNELTERCGNLVQQVDELQAERNRLFLENEALRGRTLAATAAETDTLQLRQFIVDAGNAHDSQQAQIRQLSSDLEQARDLLASQRQEVANLAKEKEGLRAQLLQSRTEIANLTSAAAEWEAKLQRHTSENVQLKQQVCLLQESVETIQAAAEGAIKYRAGEDAHYRELDAAIAGQAITVSQFHKAIQSLLDVIGQLCDWSRDSAVCLTSWMGVCLPKSVLECTPTIPKASGARHAGEVLAQCEAMKASFKRWIKAITGFLDATADTQLRSIGVYDTRGLSVCDKLQLYLDNSSEGAAHPSKGTTSASLRRHLGHTASHRVTFATAAHGQDDILHDVEHQIDRLVHDVIRSRSAISSLAHELEWQSRRR